VSNGNPLDYTNYDFDALVQQLINRVKAESTWTDTYRSATGEMLIELFGYVGNLVNYYIERRAEEGYLPTAQLRSSVIRLVRLINYTPKRKVSATGVLKFTLGSPATKRVFIPKNTECQTANQMKFLVSEDVVINVGQSSVEANAVQGELVTIEYTSTGESEQEYTINDTAVENTHLDVYVDSVEWSLVTSFIDSVNTSEEYIVTHNLDDTLTVSFGDGVNGEIPVAGKIISLQYVQSSGVTGNVYNASLITTINSTIYDEDGDTVTGISVTNEDVFLGGDDEEDIEEIRYEAPRVFATGDRAVTKADYIAILENYAGIVTANVWGEAEESPPNYDYFNKVSITILLQEWQDPSTDFKTELTDYLETKAQLTVKYEYVTADQILVVPTFTSVKVLTGYTLSNVQSAVENAVEEQFELGDTTRLGVSKRLSDLISLVDDVTGVSYHHMYLQIRKELDDTYTSTYDYGELLDAIAVATDSVKLYAGTELIGEDDGLGSITDLASGYTVSGTIDYTTGEILVDISPTPSETVYVLYQQDESGDIVVSKNQICRLYDVDVQSISYAG